ncbi:unnamed protein product [Linum trigynum]|uniref:Retrotransposon gag domain-containing protein n=1 Tax=Linum trigynum TaxID=586398 RepID=A0AAV2G9A9_9ROSI
MELCDTIKINGASVNAIRLRLFPFSLDNRAREWLDGQPRNSITTWDGLAEKFIAKYFPPSKTVKLRNDIVAYHQEDSETLYETWERFKNTLRRCPHHGIPHWLQIQTFYNRQNPETKQSIDAAGGGTINNKIPPQVEQLIEDMAMNSYEWYSPRNKCRPPPTRSAELHQVDPVTALAAQVENLNKKFDQLTVSGKVFKCEWCAGDHNTTECKFISSTSTTKYVDYINNPQRSGNPYSSTYNPGWRNHLNLS